MFYALALVCDEFFVPALDVITEKVSPNYLDEYIYTYLYIYLTLSELSMVIFETPVLKVFSKQTNILIPKTKFITFTK